MLLSNEIQLKGPFWLINDEDEEYLIAYQVELNVNTPSHKDIWNKCKGKIKKEWNYYPRGRVEIKRNKAVVYANPLCFASVNLKDMLRDKFNLYGVPIEFKADNSAHYTDGVLGVNNTMHKKEHSKCNRIKLLCTVIVASFMIYYK